VSRLRIGVVAGEPSGDILGARLLAALQSQFDEVVVEGIGGPLMQAQGLQSLFPMERLSVMGFIEPLQRLPELLRIRRKVLRHFRDNPPDLFLGIDSPDFNLAIERKLRRCGVLSAHLVSPSVWAWRQGRVRKIKRAVDLMLCLFPFEIDIYQRHAIPVRFVGHPLADEIDPQLSRQAARDALGVAAASKLVALLPGSRESEVRYLAPRFLQCARSLYQADPDIRFLLPAANAARRAEIDRQLQMYPELPLTVLSGQAREALAAADVVLLASGTATLEAALSQCPMVVTYRMSGLSWWLVSRLVRTPFAALPNILGGRALVPELIQGDATAAAMAAALQSLLSDPETAQRQLQGFSVIHQALRRDFATSAASALVELVAAANEEHRGRSS
jgi:lipid-A-disaccharide synthase